MTDRATSTMLSYALTLSIITLLVSGVFVAAGGFVDDQRERSIRAELDVIGNRIASDLAAVDRLAMTDDSASIRLRTDLPTHVAGTPYRIEFDEVGGLPTIELTTSDPAIEVTVTVKLATDLEPLSLAGGDLVITYDGAQLEVERV